MACIKLQAQSQILITFFVIFVLIAQYYDLPSSFRGSRENRTASTSCKGMCNVISTFAKHSSLMQIPWSNTKIQEIILLLTKNKRHTHGDPNQRQESHHSQNNISVEKTLGSSNNQIPSKFSSIQTDTIEPLVLDPDPAANWLKFGSVRALTQVPLIVAGVDCAIFSSSHQGFLSYYYAALMSFIGAL